MPIDRYNARDFESRWQRAWDEEGNFAGRVKPA
jgi:hypothetical protein